MSVTTTCSLRCSSRSITSTVCHPCQKTSKVLRRSDEVLNETQMLRVRQARRTQPRYRSLRNCVTQCSVGKNFSQRESRLAWWDCWLTCQLRCVGSENGLSLPWKCSLECPRWQSWRWIYESYSPLLSTSTRFAGECGLRMMSQSLSKKCWFRPTSIILTS